MQAPSPTTEPAPAASDRPQLYFFYELAGPVLGRLLQDRQLLDTLSEHGLHPRRPTPGSLQPRSLRLAGRGLFVVLLARQLRAALQRR